MPSKFSDDKSKPEDYEWYLNLDNLLKEGKEMAKKLNNEQLYQIQVLVEDSNIKYSNLKAEYYSKGIDLMSIQDCEEFLKKTLSPEYSKKILRVLEKRGYIRISNQNVILLRDIVANGGRHLNQEDKKFALTLLNEYHEYARI